MTVELKANPSDRELAAAAEYRPIEDFPGYQIGSDGTYRSQNPAPGRIRLRGDRWYVMTGHDNGNGYLVANLYRNSKRHVRYVHRLVLEAFVGRCPEGMEACHYPDPDRRNCRLDNLRWDTRKNNHADKAVHGTLLRGEQIHGAVLNASSVFAMRELFRHGVSKKDLATFFGVTPSNVYSIVERKTWKHV